MSSAAPKVRIEEIRLENFRAFDNARLTLADLTFLVGENGAGKSSLLDAVEFMREAVTDNLPNALDRREGLYGILRRGAGEDASVGVSVVMTAELAGRAIRMLYGFRILERGQTIEEALRVREAPSEGFYRRGADFETGVRGIGPQVLPERLVLPAIAITQLWDIVYKGVAGMRAYDIVPQMIATPALIRNKTALEKHGGNAGDVLADVKTRPEAYRSILARLRALTNGIADIDARVLYGLRGIYIKQRRDATHTDDFAAPAVSQGTLRALGVLLALDQSPKPTLVLFDEIEDSIHPLALDVLLEAIEVKRNELPIVVTTHSIELLNRRPAASGAGVHVIQWEAGISRMYRLGASTMQLLAQDPSTTVGSLMNINGFCLQEQAETFDQDLLDL